MVPRCLLPQEASKGLLTILHLLARNLASSTLHLNLRVGICQDFAPALETSKRAIYHTIKITRRSVFFFSNRDCGFKMLAA